MKTITLDDGEQRALRALLDVADALRRLEGERVHLGGLHIKLDRQEDRVLLFNGTDSQTPTTRVTLMGKTAGPPATPQDLTGRKCDECGKVVDPVKGTWPGDETEVRCYECGPKPKPVAKPVEVPRFPGVPRRLSSGQLRVLHVLLESGFKPWEAKRLVAAKLDITEATALTYMSRIKMASNIDPRADLEGLRKWAANNGMARLAKEAMAMPTQSPHVGEETAVERSADKGVVEIKAKREFVPTPEPLGVPNNCKATPVSEEGVAIGRKLREPFSVLDLSAMLDGPPGRANMWLADWLQRRWVSNVTFGIYKRTDKFPKEAK